MRTYTKLFQSIVTSTIWSEDDRTRIIWITMLAMANRYGEVEASIPGLAKIAGVPVPETEKAIEKLSSPDPYSRTKDHAGRRIEAIDGGWRILNHAKYREMASAEDRREQDRLRKQRVRSCPQLSAPCPQTSDLSAHTDTDTDSDTDTEREGEERKTGANAPCLPSEASLWNSKAELAGLPAVKVFNPDRARRLKARRNDFFFYENFHQIVDRVCRSKFCRGENDRGWKADFDWLLKPGTAAKVMEGKFDDPPRQPSQNCI